MALSSVGRTIPLALILTKTRSQTPRLQSQRNARAGQSLRNLQRTMQPYDIDLIILHLCQLQDASEVRLPMCNYKQYRMFKIVLPQLHYL